MEERKVSCDCCKADLTSTGNCEGWRIVLAPERVPCRSGFVTSLMVWPVLDRPYHFCGMDCLKHWLEVDWPKIPSPGARSFSTPPLYSGSVPRD